MTQNHGYSEPLKLLSCNSKIKQFLERSKVASCYEM